MSRDYVENKINEALRLNDGNVGKTKRQVHAWLFEDHKFLLELTRPHINGIVAYSVSRAKNKMLAEKASAQKEEKPAIATEESTGVQNPKKKEIAFGETMLRSFISDNAARFGHESSAPPVRKKVASQNHIDTMHMLVAASKNKKTPDTDDQA